MVGKLTFVIFLAYFFEIVKFQEIVYNYTKIFGAFLYRVGVHREEIYSPIGIFNNSTNYTDFLGYLWDNPQIVPFPDSGIDQNDEISDYFLKSYSSLINNDSSKVLFMSSPMFHDLVVTQGLINKLFNLNMTMDFIQTFTYQFENIKDNQYVYNNYSSIAIYQEITGFGFNITFQTCEKLSSYFITNLSSNLKYIGKNFEEINSITYALLNYYQENNLFPFKTLNYNIDNKSNIFEINAIVLYTYLINYYAGNNDIITKLSKISNYSEHDLHSVMVKAYNFYLYDLILNGNFYNVMVVQPFYNLLLNLTNSHINPNCKTRNVCDPFFSKINVLAIAAPETAFGALHKTFNFTNILNTEMFSTSKAFPNFQNFGYYISFDLFKGVGKNEKNVIVYDYKISVKDSMNFERNYTMYEFKKMISQFMYNPTFTPDEINDYCLFKK